MGFFPEVEALHRAVTFCHAKETLAVVALNACHKVILAVQLDGTGVGLRRSRPGDSKSGGFVSGFRSNRQLSGMDSRVSTGFSHRS